MNKFPISGSSEGSKKGPHPDYPRNIENARNFIDKTKKHLLNGMDVKISDAQNLEKALLVISWSPPKSEKIGNSATPINLHQGLSQVNKQIETIFNTYVRVVGDYEKKRPLQPELDMFGKKV